MNHFTQRLKLLFVPFLIIAICFIAGYTFLNWLLFIKLQLFSPKEGILDFGIPFVLPWIPIFIWLRPRIKLLNLKRKRGDLVALYIMISGFAIVIPTIIAQSYLETATGKLTQLDNINQINQYKATKYYTLKNCYIGKSHIGVQNSFESSGRYNEYFDMTLYVVLPIFSSAKDTLNSDCIAWYGIRYFKQISNRLNQTEKEEQFRKFLNESQIDFNNRDVNQFIYFDRIGNTTDHDGYISAIKNDKFFSDNSTIVLIPVNTPFENRNGNKFGWIFGTLGIGIVIWLLMIIIPKFDEEKFREFESGTKEKLTETFPLLKQFLLPNKGFFITPIIIDLNILIFILMVFSGLGFISFKTSDLLAWGANFRPLTADGQWWRLVTNIFLHAGFMHLFANMFGLLFVGIFLEPKLGKTRYAIAYLITGILASLTSLWMHEATVSVGASGAIFGLYGVFIALLATKIFPPKFSKVFLISTLIFVGYNLLVGLTGGIDNAAHIGGLISGFIIGLVLFPKLKQEAEYQQFLEEAQVHKPEESETDKQ